MTKECCIYFLEKLTKMALFDLYRLLTSRYDFYFESKKPMATLARAVEIKMFRVLFFDIH